MLRIVGLHRSTYYYAIKHRDHERLHKGGRRNSEFCLTLAGNMVSNEQIKEWLCDLIEDEADSYGYVKLTHALRSHYAVIINHKKVYRLCKELDILRPQRRIKARHPKRLARNRIITAPNQLWEADLKYGYIAGENRFFFVMPVLDVYDRSVVDYHIGLSCEAKDAIRTVQSALFKRQLFDTESRPVVRTDNGPQFTSHRFAQGCEDMGVEHERIPCRTPNKNAHIESFNAILEDECLRRNEFATYAEAYQTVSLFIKRYNNKRIHSSLKYMTPAAAYRLALQNQLTIKDVKV